MDRSASKLRQYTLGVVAHLLLLLAWYLFVRLGDVPRFVMPSPVDTFRALGVADYGWWANTLVTGTEIFGGYALALGVGVLSGYFLYRRYVFPGSAVPVATQARNFVFVNLFGIGIVAVLAPMLSYRLMPLILGDDRALAEAIGHGFAIGTSAVTSFFGHKWITFAKRT
jgi:NitT/TauT family transport system permease protein